MFETAMKKYEEKLKHIGLQQGVLEDKYSILIRQMDKKFGLTSFEKTAILKCKDPDLLDKAFDEFGFAETKEQVLNLIMNEE